MKDIKIGDVWYVNFPYEENDGRYKDRPAIIMELPQNNHYYKAIKCTSKPNKRTSFDYTLTDPDIAGLLNYSNVRCNKESLITERHFRRRIGKVNRTDLAQIQHLVEKAENKKGFSPVILEEFLSDCDDEVIVEMSTTNPLDPDFKKKERLHLSFFKKIPTTEENVKKYKSQVPSLCHVRTGEDYKGYIYLDGDKVVGYIVVHDDGNYNLREIQALEVTKDYRGCGLSKQLLQVAINELRANATTVSKSNEITLKINKDLGFKTIPRRGNAKMYYQTLGGKSVDSILNESSIDMRQFEFISCPDPEDGVSRAQNSVVKIKGRQFRARVETLIVKDGKIYAQKLDKINKYGYGCKFPGGGIEPNISVEDSAQKECNEEARIVVDDLKYSGVSYVVDFNGEYPEWHKKKLWKYGLKYEGSICYIFVGCYDKKYTGEVEKIDYDDLFKHGKFYEIDELDLLPEHKQALKSYGILKESYISEGVADLTFYHGSDKKLDEITPTSPNMGNKLEPAKWCCYLWKDKDRAIKFAVQKSLRNYRTKLKNKGNEFSSIVYDVTNGKSMLLDTEYEDIKKLSIKANLKAYIHTVEAPLSTVGIGHASSIPEYTSTATLPVQKVDTVEIDSKIFDSVFEKGTEEDKNKLLDKALHSKARGVLAYLMDDQVETYKKEMKVKKAMKNGELSIGDDMSVIIASDSCSVIGNARYFNQDDVENYSPENQIKRFYDESSKYEPPYSIDDIKKNYPHKADILLKDPIHRWRAETGIELIHKEPTLEELNRIWRNWNKMTDEQKKKSDKKSIELFGMDNITHYKEIKNEYTSKIKECGGLVEESAKTYDGYKKNFKSFDDLCNYIDTPEELCTWTKINKCRFPDDFYNIDRAKLGFYWADDIVKDKFGTCLDYALFMHYLCEKKGIENYIARFADFKRIVGENEYSMVQHFISIYKYGNLWYIYNYNPRVYGILGPYKTLEDAYNYYVKRSTRYLGNEAITNTIFGSIDKRNLKDIKQFHAIMKKEEFKMIDKFVGDKKISRDDFMFKYKYCPSIVSKYDNGEANLHHDFFERLQEKIKNAPDIIRDKIISTIFRESSNINECGGLAGGPGGMVGATDLSVITQYGYKNSESDEVEGYAVHNDILTTNVITTNKKGKVVKESMDEFLKGRKIRMFEYVGDRKDALKEIVNNLGNQKYREYFYEELTGRLLLCDDQILCDEEFKEISPAEINESKNSKIQTIFAEFKEITGDPIQKYPLMNPLDIREANFIIGKNFKKIRIYENINGYFAENIENNRRTGYYKEINKIQLGAIL